MIDSSAVQSLRRTDTKLLAYGPFLEMLRGQGHACATNWLDHHAAQVGRQSTVNVKKLFA